MKKTMLLAAAWLFSTSVMAVEIESNGWVFELPEQASEQNNSTARSARSGKRPQPVLVPGTKVLERQRGEEGVIGNTLLVRTQGDIDAYLDNRANVTRFGQSSLMLSYPQDTDMWAEKQRLERLDDVLEVEIEVITNRYRPM
ncbi:hypothetical protein GCM10011297_19460 [Bacterioplanes sanyensis]|uniref:hypothetical protein n=1 Tax=Bacterioplanes sanyensis TaxID=1249553 RepID=UPI001679FAEC|nr:hypothetical protein [Bacterioplanes sanyensis]GGY46710.1 hypothetical protein GCM10011297_19460 [Bacterioplanes sanyensis]